MTKKNRDRLWVWWFIIIVGGLWVFAQATKSATKDMVIDTRVGFQCDSIKMLYHKGITQTVDSSWVITAPYGRLDTLTTPDSLYLTWTALYYPTGFSHPAASNPWVKTPRDTTGVPTSGYMPVWAYWYDSSARVRTSRYTDGTLVGTANVTDSAYHYIAYIPVTNANRSTYLVRIQFPGYDSLFTWTFSRNTANSSAGAVIPVPIANVCQFTIRVIDNTGDPAEGAIIRGFLTKTNVMDSAGHVIRNAVLVDTADVNGYVTFNCVWSGYLIPSASWMFTGQTSRGIYEWYQLVTIPSQYYDTLIVGM